MITTAEYLALPPQERWAIIEERVFGRRVIHENGKPKITTESVNRSRYWVHFIHPDYGTEHHILLDNRDEPDGWWEIVEEMRRRKYRAEIGYFSDDNPCGAEFWNDTEDHFDANPDIALAVQAAALRVVRFIGE